MTTYQEPPLQSRRAARQQRERDEASSTPQQPAVASAFPSRRSLRHAAEPVTEAFSPQAPFPAAVPLARPAAEEQPAFATSYPVPVLPAPLTPAPEAAAPGPSAPAPAAPAPVAPEFIAPAPAASAPAAPAPVPAESPAIDRVLSRRELRAAREAAGVSTAPVDESAPLQPYRGRRAVEPAAPAQPAPASAVTTGAAPVEQAEAPAPSPADPLGTRVGPPTSPLGAPFLLPALALEPEPPVLVAPPAVAPAPAPFTAQAAPSAAPAPAAAPVALIEPAPTTGERPVGHWSTQAELDDRVQVHESGVGRSVSAGGPATTSMLVIPMEEDPAAIGTLSLTGEVLVTGTIALPQSLAATGAHPAQLDRADIDHILEGDDQQVVSTDSTPVRAISAVSTHTATSGIITPRRRNSNRSLTILIVSAATMAVLVGALVVVALVADVF